MHALVLGQLVRTQPRGLTGSVLSRLEGQQWRTALPADVEVKLAVPDQGYIFDKQAQNPLAFAGWCARVVPHPGQIRDQ
jgi:hypothetical protein